VPTLDSSDWLLYSSTLNSYQDWEMMTFAGVGIRDADSVLVSTDIIRLFRKMFLKSTVLKAEREGHEPIARDLPDSLPNLARSVAWGNLYPSEKRS
jgi:hypothetical protein